MTKPEGISQSGPFPETADIETSSDNYALRFAGATGKWMLNVQEEIVLNMLKASNVKTVLDVGGGHGQLAIPLCHNNYDVTVLGSAESCRKRIAEIVDSRKCKFMAGNLIELPFPDRSFDTVISFRLLTHCKKFPKLIEELCRVAKYLVIVDYPTSESLNKFAPMLFKAKKKIEGNTRVWTLFRHEEIFTEFVKHSYVLKSKIGEYFLPMVLHRALKCRRVSVFLERLCRLAGLTKLWGSPVIIKMIRGV